MFHTRNQCRITRLFCISHSLLLQSHPLLFITTCETSYTQTVQYISLRLARLTVIQTFFIHSTSFYIQKAVQILTSQRTQYQPFHLRLPRFIFQYSPCFLKHTGSLLLLSHFFLQPAFIEQSHCTVGRVVRIIFQRHIEQRVARQKRLHALVRGTSKQQSITGNLPARPSATVDRQGSKQPVSTVRTTLHQRFSLLQQRFHMFVVSTGNKQIQA